MAKDQPQQLVQMSTVFASGITAIVAALFTSRLGVAGTLIGTALTPMLMTIGVAVLNTPIQKATSRISELPSTVRGRASSQRVRIPGTPSPEENTEEPEPPAPPERRRDRRTPGTFERLLSIPAYLREMSPSTRRRTLLTGALAGLVAAVIGLGGVTGIEAASGSPFSCTLWDKCPVTTASGGATEQASTSFSRAFGGSGNTQTQSVPSGSEQTPAQGPQQEAQPAPGAQQVPQDQQYQSTTQGGEAPGQAPAGQQTQQGQEQPSGQDTPGSGAQNGSQQPAAPGAEQAPATPSGQGQ